MEFKVNTGKREEIVDITDYVEKIVRENSDKKSKACLVFVKHTSASIVLNENYDKKIEEDLLDYLRKHIPKGKWKHDVVDGNGDSHIKAAIIGANEIIPIENKELLLGQWQNIGLIEFDGPRERTVIVKVI